MIQRIGVLPLGRATFDVPFAEERTAKAFEALDRSGHTILGARSLLFDADSAESAITDLLNEDLDLVLILQATFTDAAVTVEIADQLKGPLAIWAFPEPRLGGRLRLNAFCGLNLAAHALGLSDRPFSSLYAAPDSRALDDDLADLLTGSRIAKPVAGELTHPTEAGEAVAGRLSGKRIGRLGEHPDGFHTCAYDPAALSNLTGVTVDPLPLKTVFEKAGETAADTLAESRATAEKDLQGLQDVDQTELDRSLRLDGALQALRGENGYDAFAVRCWPETFTEYGGAICGPVSMMGERRVPCACEADVYGAVTNLILQDVADAPIFMVDLVDLDTDDDTGVVWHCGQAPISMAAADLADDQKPLATIHSNRRMPLLYEFPLKPGRVTFARLSQALGRTSVVIFGGEMLDRPKAFTGTSGVVRFDRSAGEMFDRVIGSGLEHHTTLAYGDHRAALRGVAGALGLPVLEL